MTNLPAALRARLHAEVPLSTLTVEAEARSDDGTVKALFHTGDGRPLEAVLMRYRDGRRSICVSSQSGCPLTCTFCATGRMRFARNLTASEILDQALHFRRLEVVNHAVFMGMGEPFLNVDAVLAAALARSLGPDAFKVNLIPYNPTGLYDGSARATIEAFKVVLDRARIPATV